MDSLDEVYKSINIKDKLTEDDFNKLGFCILNKLLCIDNILQRLSGGVIDPDKAGYIRVEVLLDFLGFDLKKVKETGTRFYKEKGLIKGE